MLELIFGLIPGLFKTVNGITNAIVNERINLAKSQTDADKIAAEEKIATLQAQRDVMVAESSRSSINAYIRAWIGGSVAFVLSKILVWDKALGDYTGGHTDSLDPNLWNVIMATIGFYFLYEGAVNATRIWKS